MELRVDQHLVYLFLGADDAWSSKYSLSALYSLP